MVTSLEHLQKAANWLHSPCYVKNIFLPPQRLFPPISSPSCSHFPLGQMLNCKWCQDNRQKLGLSQKNRDICLPPVMIEAVLCSCLFTVLPCSCFSLGMTLKFITIVERRLENSSEWFQAKAACNAPLPLQLRPSPTSYKFGMMLSKSWVVWLSHECMFLMLWQEKAVQGEERDK